MKTVDDLNFSGKKALVRVDFNVPLDKDYTITDDTRMTAAVPTLRKILGDGGAAILMSHLGRPKEGPTEKYSLKHLTSHLSELLGGVPVHFASDCVGEEAEQKSRDLPMGEVLLLENTRFHAGETKGDEAMAAQLAKLGDVYVNDAFGSAHRAHASTTVVAQHFSEKASGYVMRNELANADKLLKDTKHPFVAIMGGAKISDKIGVIENLLDKVDDLIIGGGMSYTFFKAMGGLIGSSLVEEDKLDLANQLIKQAKEKNVNLHLPIDSVVADKFDNDAQTKIANNHAIEDGWMGLDIGPEAREVFANVIRQAKTVLWNGPMGVFEMENFAAGTKTVAEAVVAATRDGAFSLIGGGDSAAAVNSLGYGDDVSYVSTGGGALLEYMEGKELPGVKALQ
jgi:phosphoglycerate kinase